MFYNHVFSGTRSKTLKGGGVVSGIAKFRFLDFYRAKSILPLALARGLRIQETPNRFSPESSYRCPDAY